jgi:hypothetical protein
MHICQGKKKTKTKNKIKNETVLLHNFTKKRIKRIII